MKKLYVDASHKKAKIQGLKKGKAIIKKIASIGLTLSIFSGAQKILQEIDNDSIKNITVSHATEVSDEFIEPDDEDIIYFPASNDSECFIYFFGDDGKATFPISMKYKDMKNIKYLCVKMVDGVDYSCLNYFPNLEIIKFSDYGNNNLEGFDGTNIKSDITVTYVNADLKFFDENTFPFLETIPNISDLHLACGFELSENIRTEIDWNYISSLKNVKKLNVTVDDMNGFNIKDFAHLDRLQLYGQPVEVAKKFNYDSIEECEKLGIKLEYNQMDKLMQIVAEPTDEEVIKLNNNVYVSFDNSCDYSQYVQYETMKYSDMKKVKSLLVNIYDKCDYNCLNYFPNVENLVINDYGFDYNLDNVYGMKFKKDINITYYLRSVYNFDYNFLHYQRRIAFFNDISSINKLIIDSDINWEVQFIDWKCIEQLKNVRNLSIYLDLFANFKFEDYSHLDTLELRGAPYDVGMYVSTDDIRRLNESGVEVKYDQLNDLNDINQKLDQIYTSLNINDSMDDFDKINKIVQYVLKTLEYDQKMKEMNNDGLDTSEYTHSFYIDGFLYGALEKETQICGNFSALTNALLKRANVNSFNIYSTNHMWNLIELEDYYYSLDTTALDNYEDYMNSGLYLGDPTITHPSAVYPDFFKVKSIPKDEKEKINSIIIEKMSEGEFVNIKDQDIQVAEDTQTYKLIIKDKVYVVSAVALVGLLSGIGIGTFIAKKKEEKNRHIK